MCSFWERQNEPFGLMELLWQILADYCTGIQNIYSFIWFHPPLSSDNRQSPKPFALNGRKSCEIALQSPQKARRARRRMASKTNSKAYGFSFVALNTVVYSPPDYAGNVPYENICIWNDLHTYAKVNPKNCSKEHKWHSLNIMSNQDHTVYIHSSILRGGGGGIALFSSESERLLKMPPRL